MCGQLRVMTGDVNLGRDTPVAGPTMWVQCDDGALHHLRGPTVTALSHVRSPLPVTRQGVGSGAAAPNQFARQPWGR